MTELANLIGGIVTIAQRGQAWLFAVEDRVVTTGGSPGIAVYVALALHAGAEGQTPWPA